MSKDNFFMNLIEENMRMEPGKSYLSLHNDMTEIWIAVKDDSYALEITCEEARALALILNKFLVKRPSGN